MGLNFGTVKNFQNLISQLCTAEQSEHSQINFARIVFFYFCAAAKVLQTCVTLPGRIVWIRQTIASSFRWY